MVSKLPNRSAIAEAQRFARENLGPKSLELLQSVATEASVDELCEDGMSPADAALYLVHAHARTDLDFAGEFLNHFAQALFGMHVTDQYPGLRRHLETTDVVQSVMGDIWRDLVGLEFVGRSAFLSLLVQRLRWKANDKQKWLRRGCRREEMRTEAEVGALTASTEQDAPDSQMIRREEHRKAMIAVMRLPPRDREMVRQHLAGRNSSQIAAELKMTPAAVRKALERALRRTREAAGS